MRNSLTPRRALAHPLWVAALLVLVTNDHYLKTAGILPGWFTGKLSDFAGLLVAPALLAAIVSASTLRGALLAHAVIGAVFAAIKVDPAAARAFEALTSLTPFPWVITVDPTDLIALPMLGVSFLVFTRAAAPRTRSEEPRRTEIPGAYEPVAQRVLVMAGSIACMATSPQTPPCPGGSCGVAPAGDGALVIANATDKDRLVRLRRLKTTVSVDCDALMADPSSAMSRQLFAPAEAWLLQPTRALILTNGVGCSAYLVDADGLDMTLLAWRESDFVTQPISTSLGGPGNNDGTGESREIVMRVDPDLGRIELDPHAAIFEAPPAEDPAPGGGCETPSDEMGVEWSTPIPLGTHEITALESAPDGCAAIDFKDAERFYLCVPQGSIPFAVGDSVDLASWTPDQGKGLAEAGGEAVDSKGLSITSATAAMIVARGNVIARWQSPDFEDYSVEADPVVGCPGAHDLCGSLVMPLSISLFGGTAPDITILRAGEKAALAQGAGTLFLVRAQETPIADSSCGSGGDSRRLYESILVRKN